MIRQFLIRFPQAIGIRHMVAFLCLYETFSIEFKRSPTLSVLASRHRWLAPLLLIALGVHFYLMPPPVTEQDMIDMEGRV
jgi:hypothetical protein